MANGWGLGPFFPLCAAEFSSFQLLIYGTTSFFFTKGAILEVIWSYVWAFGKYGSYMELRFFREVQGWQSSPTFWKGSTSGSMLVFGGICFLVLGG